MAQKSWKLGKPQLWRLLEPSRRHILKLFFHIWALTNLNIINPKGHKCSCLGRTRPDGSKIWIFTSTSRFLLWLGEISHIWLFILTFMWTFKWIRGTFLWTFIWKIIWSFRWTFMPKTPKIKEHTKHKTCKIHKRSAQNLPMICPWFA